MSRGWSTFPGHPKGLIFQLDCALTVPRCDSSWERSLPAEWQADAVGDWGGLSFPGWLHIPGGSLVVPASPFWAQALHLASGWALSSGPRTHCERGEGA